MMLMTLDEQLERLNRLATPAAWVVVWDVLHGHVTEATIRLADRLEDTPAWDLNVVRYLAGYGTGAALEAEDWAVLHAEALTILLYVDWKENTP